MGWVDPWVGLEIRVTKMDAWTSLRCAVTTYRLGGRCRKAAAVEAACVSHCCLPDALSRRLVLKPAARRHSRRRLRRTLLARTTRRHSLFRCCRLTGRLRRRVRAWSDSSSTLSEPSASVPSQPAGRQAGKQRPANDLLRVSNKCTAVRRVATPLRELTCHMESHSVTCHPAEVSFPPSSQNLNLRRLERTVTDCDRLRASQQQCHELSPSA